MVVKSPVRRRPETRNSLRINRHAERIADLRGYEKFVVLAYSERVESDTLGARRVAKGLIKLEKDLEPPPPEPL